MTLQAKNEKYVPIKKENGEIDTGVIFEVDLVRVNEMFEFLVRGLHFAFLSTLLPVDSKFRFGKLMKNDVDWWVNFFNQNGGNSESIGDGEVFKCVYQFGTDNPDVSFWFLEFYGRAHYSAIAMPSDFQVPARPE